MELVGYWKFNEGTGTIAYDASGGGQSGTLSGTAGTPTWDKQGKAGLCLDFDDTDNQYVLVSEAAGGITNPLTTVSVCAWSKFNDETNSKTIVHRTDAYRLRINSTEAPGFQVFTTGWAGVNGANSSVLINTWHFLVGTYDGTTLQIFLDGVLVNSGAHSNPGNMNQTGANLNLGQWGVDTDPFAGKLDEIRIYDKVLTSSEISILYNNGKIGWGVPSWGNLPWGSFRWSK